ncbi:MAG: hypothetical protein WC877_00385 [Dehalococcoidales bacterium]|jgi:hypothetical protein
MTDYITALRYATPSEVITTLTILAIEEEIGIDIISHPIPLSKRTWEEIMRVGDWTPDIFNILHEIICHQSTSDY